MFKWVKDGETAYGFLFETTLRDYLAAGAALAPVLTEEGLITQADGMGLIAGAPHPDGARLFLSFLSSAQAHEIVRETAGRRSARRDVTPAQGLLDLHGRRLIEPDPLRLSREREAILLRFEQARAAR
jgi:iron(III) transport system substrate-binding protein